MTDAAILFSDRVAEPPQTRGATHWLIVSQVKSNRVLYFTDDQDYRPSEEGDWCYVSSHLGELPAEMTLRNCWSWRYDGEKFLDAREAPARPKREALVENNRRALMTLLNDKIAAVRAPYEPSTAMGEAVRRAKLDEAIHFQSLAVAPAAPPPGRRSEYPLLEAAAVARNITMTAAAELIVTKAMECTTVLCESERFREQMARAIEVAETDTDLLALREWLLNDIYPALSERFKYPIDRTKPIDPDAPLDAVTLTHERARLKAQLREKINLKRASLHSDYVQNDAMLKHKAKLAQLVLANGGVAPEGVDCTLLQSYAEARGMELAEVARLVDQGLNSASQLLSHTEVSKDLIIYNIESTKTAIDIIRCSKEIGRIAIDSEKYLILSNIKNNS